MYTTSLKPRLNSNSNRMFIMYKKLASPDASPVLGPATPKESPVIGPAVLNASTSTLNASTSTLNASTSTLNASTSTMMEPFSLYNCCCSPRNNNNNNNNNVNNQDTTKITTQSDKLPDNIKPKYEFGHATHYAYIATTSRLLCEFETGTP